MKNKNDMADFMIKCYIKLGLIPSTSDRRARALFAMKASTEQLNALEDTRLSINEKNSKPANSKD